MLTLTCPYCNVTGEETELTPGYEANVKRRGQGALVSQFVSRITEVSAAAVSTLQWGDGDLVMNRSLGCGAWTC